VSHETANNSTNFNLNPIL